VQGTGEQATFTEQELQALVRLAKGGIARLGELQQESLGPDWPWK